MIRRCAKNISCSLHLANVARGLAAVRCVNGSHTTDRRHFSSGSHERSSSSTWSSLALGLAFGAAGASYWLFDDSNVAHCGGTDSWTYKPKQPSTKQNEPVSAAVSEDKPEDTDEKVSDSQSSPEADKSLPSHVPYLIIGAGTAGMAAYRAIRTKHLNAKVLLVGDEEYKPYMRPPLSKDMWGTEKALVDECKFKTWSGRDRSLFFEKDSYYCQPSELATCDKGGVAVATSVKATRLDAEKKQVTLSDGSVIGYDKCLIATGGRPRNLPALQRAGDGVMEKVTLFRGINDFKRLNAHTDNAKSVVVIGGGFLGSELACALGKKAATTSSGMSVMQVFPEQGNMGRVLPKYLSDWTTGKVRSENVTVVPQVTVEKCRLSEDGKQVELLLNTGEELSADHVVVAVGLEPNTELAGAAGLEVDDRLGGFLVNAELEAASDIWVAGDAACFYDVKLGRRRVEHHDHAVVSGRLAGENMAGGNSKRFFHQSMFWSDLGPDVGYEAIGLVSSELPTVAVFAKASASDTPASAEQRTGESLRSETEQNAAPGDASGGAEVADKYGKGVIFYMRGKRVVGVICWNVFNKIGIARKIIKDGAEYEDLTEVAKLFDLHPRVTAEQAAEQAEAAAEQAEAAAEQAAERAEAAAEQAAEQAEAAAN